MMAWQSPRALICDQCGYEVKIEALEVYNVTTPIDNTDMSIDWGNREMIHCETLIEKATCRCRICPYIYDATTDKVSRNEANDETPDYPAEERTE